MKVCTHGIDRNRGPELEFVPNIHHGVRSELIHRDAVTKRSDERTRQIGVIAMNHKRPPGEIQVGSPGRGRKDAKRRGAEIRLVFELAGPNRPTDRDEVLQEPVDQTVGLEVERRNEALVGVIHGNHPRAGRDHRVMRGRVRQVRLIGSLHDVDRAGIRRG